jgi:hypothetical protein
MKKYIIKEVCIFVIFIMLAISVKLIGDYQVTAVNKLRASIEGKYGLEYRVTSPINNTTQYNDYVVITKDCPYGSIYWGSRFGDWSDAQRKARLKCVDLREKPHLIMDTTYKIIRVIILCYFLYWLILLVAFMLKNKTLVKKILNHLTSKDFLIRLVLVLVAIYLMLLIGNKFHKNFLSKSTIGFNSLF